MSECPRCPNCGLVNPEEFCGWWWCGDCGARWQWSRTNRAYHDVLVPRRSLPAEVLELPDGDGWWWMFWQNGGKRCMNILVMDGISKFEGDVEWKRCQPGRYVRAEPPIVAPEPVKHWDEDAQRLLAIFNAPYWSIEDKNLALRIAERLEPRRKEPEPVKDEDAAILRRMYALLTEQRVQIPLEVVDNLDRLGRIADRLERQEKEPR